MFGGWVGDRFGPRKTLFVCGLIWAAATILTGFAGGLVSLFLVRVLLGIGEGATFPVATRAMQSWTIPARRGFAQGITHAFARFGNAVTPPLVAWLIALVTWRGSFVTLGCVSVLWVVAWVWYFRDVPASHPGMTPALLEPLPNHGQPLAVIMAGFLGSFICLLPMFLTTDLTIITLALGAAFFCAELVIGPMWSIPMDIAGKYSGTASGLMNTGSALAAILSPLAFGIIADMTGDWVLPFVGSLGLLLLGAALSPFMHPERPFVDPAPALDARV